jgi:hypothetical protein
VAQIKLIGIDGQGFLVSRLSLQAETELLEVRQLLADTEFQKTADSRSGTFCLVPTKWKVRFRRTLQTAEVT